MFLMAPTPLASFTTFYLFFCSLNMTYLNVSFKKSCLILFSELSKFVIYYLCH